MSCECCSCTHAVYSGFVQAAFEYEVFSTLQRTCSGVCSSWAQRGAGQGERGPFLSPVLCWGPLGWAEQSWDPWAPFTAGAGRSGGWVPALDFLPSLSLLPNILVLVLFFSNEFCFILASRLYAKRCLVTCCKVSCEIWSRLTLCSSLV